MCGRWPVSGLFPEEKKMELREYAATILKWWWLILLATAVAGVSAWYVVKDKPPVYQTSTTLMIGRAIQQTNPDYSDFYTSQQLAQTYSELIKREPVLKATAAALGFEEQWRRLKGQVAVSVVPGTQLIEIRVTDTNPERAKLIVDELARQLVATVEKARPMDDSRTFIQEEAATLPPKIRAAREEIRELEAELSTVFSASQIRDLRGRITTLENQIRDWQATYAQFQLLLGDAGANVLTVIEEAPMPSSPIGSSWLMEVALTAAIGGMLAVGAAFVIEYLDDTVRTTEDLAKASGLPTLGVLARISGERPADRLVVAQHPRNPISEAYRSLRTGLRYSSPDRPLRSLLVTSSHAKEGKSTVLANLAVAMAQAGQSVVVVDSDLRRPMQHRLFGVENVVGLTSTLMDGGLFMNGFLQETGIENLRVMTSGPLPPNPSELLGSQKMKDLMEDLAKQADVVLYDTPPLLPVTDGVVLATRADAVLIVAESGRTRRGSLQRALDSLRQVGATVAGVALNGVSRRGPGGYYYYYYYYSMDQQGRRVRRRKRSRRAWDSVKEQRGTLGPADAPPGDMVRQAEAVEDGTPLGGAPQAGAVEEATAPVEAPQGPTARDAAPGDEVLQGPAARDAARRDKLAQGPAAWATAPDYELPQGPAAWDAAPRDEADKEEAPQEETLGKVERHRGRRPRRYEPPDGFGYQGPSTEEA
jgi:non-specific protein-tyrosine kinase